MKERTGSKKNKTDIDLWSNHSVRIQKFKKRSNCRVFGEYPPFNSVSFRKKKSCGSFPFQNKKKRKLNLNYYHQ